MLLKDTPEGKKGPTKEVQQGHGIRHQLEAIVLYHSVVLPDLGVILEVHGVAHPRASTRLHPHPQQQLLPTAVLPEHSQFVSVASADVLSALYYGKHAILPHTKSSSDL